MILGILGAYLIQARGSWISECGLMSSELGLGMVVVSVWLGFSLAVIVSLILRIPSEDALLRARFGEKWVAWAERTPYRLIPGVM